MKRKAAALAAVALFVLALGVIAGAQGKTDVSGAWKLTQPGRNGDVTNDVTLTQSGGMLTGTLKTQQGESPITGSVDGNNITMTVKRTTPNGEQTNEYKGTIDGDTMKGSVTMGQRTVDWTAARNKS
jgi:hypothetical protein